MLYTSIAEAIAEQQLRTELGATPAATVNATITTSMNNEGEASPFQRVSRGLMHCALWLHRCQGSKSYKFNPPKRSSNRLQTNKTKRGSLTLSECIGAVPMSFGQRHLASLVSSR